jgi:hypothetical protein
LLPSVNLILLYRTLILYARANRKAILDILWLLRVTNSGIPRRIAVGDRTQVSRKSKKCFGFNNWMYSFSKERGGDTEPVAWQ